MTLLVTAEPLNSESVVLRGKLVIDDSDPIQTVLVDSRY